MKTIIITGGCGFIGGHFIRLINRLTDWRVVNVDKLTYAGSVNGIADLQEGQRYRFVKADIVDRDRMSSLFAEEKPWAVVNFAAESHVDRSILDSGPFLQTNLIGVQVLLDMARQYDVERFLQISTDEVYGDAEGKESFTEGSLLSPSSPYSSSKASADLLCLSYLRTYGLPVFISRSTNNYGPHQYPEKLIPLMIRNAMLGQELPVYGDGLQRRDWISVEDNIQAIYLILTEGNSGSIYNVGTEKDVTNLEVVEEICRGVANHTGWESEKLIASIQHIEDRPGHDRRYAVDTQKIRTNLGWTPSTSFQAGIRSTVAWYLQNPGWEIQSSNENYQRYKEAVYSKRWGRSKN
jgi:dTDP-glucose 4,6-dehydratase